MWSQASQRKGGSSTVIVWTVYMEDMGLRCVTLCEGRVSSRQSHDGSNGMYNTQLSREGKEATRGDVKEWCYTWSVFGTLVQRSAGAVLKQLGEAASTALALHHCVRAAV